MFEAAEWRFGNYEFSPESAIESYIQRLILQVLGESDG
jgi:hypothetical protein